MPKLIICSGWHGQEMEIGKIYVNQKVSDINMIPQIVSYKVIRESNAEEYINCLVELGSKPEIMRDYFKYYEIQMD